MNGHGLFDMTSRLMEINPGYNQPVETKDAMVSKINSLLPFIEDYSEWTEMFLVALPADFFTGEPDKSLLDHGRFINPVYEIRRENESGGFTIPKDQPFMMNQCRYIGGYYQGKRRVRVQFRKKPQAEP